MSHSIQFRYTEINLYQIKHIKFMSTNIKQGIEILSVNQICIDYVTPFDQELCTQKT